VAGALALVVAIAAIGFGLTWWMADLLRFEERLAIGVVVGTVAVGITALVTFLVIGMGPVTLAVGLGVPAAAALTGVWRDRARLLFEVSWAGERIRLPWRDSRSLRPLAALTLAGAVVSTRTLALAYQATPTGLSAGSLATWADGAAHAAYAGSFAFGDNRVLDLPIAAGHGFTYHFLADFVAALFTVVGASVPQGLSASAWMLAVAWPVLVWSFVYRIAARRLAAGLTVVLFTLSGGLGFRYFIDDVARDGWGIVSNLPRTYARMPEQHLWVDNTISVSLFAQRSTQLGLVVGLVAGIVLLASRPAGRRRGFLAAGVLIGALGIGHAHMLATAIALGGLAWVADRRAIWWWFLTPALVIGGPLTLAISPDTNSMRWLVGWMAPAADQSWLWFWLRNVGLLLPVFAAVSIGAVAGYRPVPARIARLTLPLWLWFLVPNLVAFHPWEGNNEKFFLFWRFAASLAIAALVAQWWPRVRWSRPLSVAVVGTLVAAGSLDAVRAMQRGPAIPWATHDDLAVATWMRDHTPADAVIVYGMTNTSAAFSLGGRRAVSGYEGWTYDLGIADWYQRVLDSSAILAGAPDAAELVARYSVDYVVIGPHEREQRGASDMYWSEHGEQVFCAGEHCLYATGG